MYLGENQLTSLPAEIGQLTSLQGLFLWGNQLTSLPAEIRQLTSLRVLDLSGNQLASVPAEIGQLTAMTIIPQLHMTSLLAEIGSSRRKTSGATS